ncbi:MAG: hypothetical protein LUH05_03995 [Candidatus Gastranaerophilales bacterium]|nr:hypothetical protein [Candidatus Gastranaerophilales bacterium]
MNNKKIITILCLVMFAAPAFADNIQYGYNAVGEYVPVKIGNDRVKYGYNAVGDYVPTSIGNNKIKYGYNAQGNYVPTSIQSSTRNYNSHKNRY